MEKAKPQLVINCAAAANIDWCEQNPDEALLINSEVPGRLAEICLKKDINLLHISTDAVFDGKQVEYTEEDIPNPQSVYARSKLLGEQNVVLANQNALISRVNFYGFSVSGTRSLAEFFINNLSAGEAVNGFVDVFFSPLYVKDLVSIFLLMVSKSLTGIYHTVSSESLSKYAFGMNIARKFRFDKSLINPTSVNEGNLLAKRSPLLMLKVDKLMKAGIKPPPQSQGIEKMHEDYLDGLPHRLKALQG